MGGIASAGAAAGKASQAAAALSFIMNLVLSASMNLLWSMMNTLQIIVHLPLINLAFPKNAQAFSAIFLSLAQFDILPHSNINPALFKFSSRNKAVAKRFANCDYETSNFIRNVGSVFWFAVAWCMFAFFCKLLKRSRFKFIATKA